MPRHPPEEQPFPMPLFPLHNNTLHQPLPMLPVLPPYHLALPSPPHPRRSESAGRDEYLFASNRRWRVLRKSGLSAEIRKWRKQTFEDVIKGFDSGRHRGRVSRCSAVDNHISGGECFTSHLALADCPSFSPPTPFFLNIKQRTEDLL